MSAATYTTESLSVIHAASDDATKYNINSVHFTEDGSTVATDGHMLAKVTPEKPVKVEPFTVELKGLAPVAKEVKRARKAGGHLSLENPEDIGAPGWGATIPFTAATKSVTGEVQIPRVDGDYPAYGQVIPQLDSSNSLSVGVSLSVLERMVAIAREFTGTRKGETTAIHLRIPTDPNSHNTGCLLSPFTAETKSDDLNLLLVGMPMRIR